MIPVILTVCYFTANSFEMVEGMWLGVTVASQKGHPAGRVLVRWLSFTFHLFVMEKQKRKHLQVTDSLDFPS